MTVSSTGRISTTRHRLAVVLAAAVVIASSGTLLTAQGKVDIKTLAPQYQEWWKLVTYIISDTERDVFLHLTTDRDRDIFIDAFWKVRDPTPGTPQNEFKEQHIKRFQEANKRFRFGSTREGWMTDQGRIYIILGKPINTTDFPGTNDTYPGESWAYYGDTSKGMPTHFELLFYRWHNVGEMKLYDPAADTPARLLTDPNQFNSFDYAGMYQKIQDVDPDLARVCLSIIPGEIPMNFQPSLDSTIYLAAILDSPKKGLNDRYASHFLNYRAVVSTEYLTNYMNADGEVAILEDPMTGLTFCNFALAPERLSVDLYEPKNEYSTDFQVDVSLRSGEKIILQYSKDFPLTFPEAKIGETEKMGVCIADAFPVIEGKFKLTVLLRNTVGKEFSVFEREIEVPAPSAGPHLSAPVIGFKLADAQTGAHLPFRAEDKKLNVDPKMTFVAGDDISFIFSGSGFDQNLWKTGSVGIAIKGTRAASPYQKAFSILLATRPYQPAFVFSQTLSASDLPPDYYEMALTLMNGQGAVLDEKRSQFIITPVKGVPHPLVASKAVSAANIFMFQYMLAYQYDATGQTALAEGAYKKALGLNPSYKNKVPDYAGLLLRNGRFDDALKLVETIQDESKLRFQYHLLKGRALQGLGRYNDAIESLRQGNAIYNSDAGLLAALGTCYYKTGQKEKALAALKASLSLNQEQADVRELIAEIEGKK